MKTLRLAWLFFLLAFGANGQELYGKYLDHEQGLLSKECYDIICDKKGYLLISTQYGPVKYDGEKCTPICLNLPIEERVIYDFEKAPDGTIYLLNSKQQILKLEGNKAIHIGPKKLPYDFADFVFIKLHWTKSGLYILTCRSILKYSFQSKKIGSYYKHVNREKSFTTYTYDSQREFPFFKYIHLDRSFFSNQDIIIRFPESNRVFEYQNSAHHDPREDEVTVGKTSYLIICERLFRKKGKQITPLDFKDILFIEYFHNRIWLCTFDGLLELDLNGRLLHHYFRGELVAGVAPLKSGGIAVSFNRKGVFICSNIHNRIYSNMTASSTASIHSRNLIGTVNGGIYQYTHNNLSRLAQIDSLGYAEKIGLRDAIHEIQPFGDKIIVTSTNGVYCFDQNFLPILKNIDHRCYYFGSFTYKDFFHFILRVGIRKTTWKEWTSLSFAEYQLRSKQINLKKIRCHLRLNDSIMLLGADNGLFNLNLKTDQIRRSLFFEQESGVTTLKRTSSGELVVFSRYQGIYLFKNKQLIQRISAPCVSITSGAVYKNNLIVQGNDGVFIRQLNDSKNTEWIKIFNGETESVFALENNLLISYGNDLIISKLNNYRLADQTCVVLNDVKIGGLQKKYIPLEIAPDQAMSLDFDILIFGADKLDLYYRLKGKNTIYQLEKGTQINFDALKSGKYVLEVYPVINGKIHFKNPKTYHFTIQPTFWESTVFFIITGVLIISIIVSVFLVINLRRKRRSAERAVLESRLNEYKLLAVKAQVNPHFLSNGLAAIQALILKNDNDLAAQYLAKFSFLMRKILYYSETQFIPLKQELELVDAYLELELLRFRNRFSIQKEIHLTEDQLTNFLFPSLLLQPILENAIWHGLKFQENNPELRIAIALNQEGALVVQITDNGPGFNPSGHSEEHLSKGNQLINERIETLNQQFQKRVASLEINSSPSGTIVTFIFNSQIYLSGQT